MTSATLSRPLLLVPTQLEANYIDAAWSGRYRIELCGFGPVVAAARTSLLLAQLRPPSVLLVGIAGSLPVAQGRLRVGEACEFDTVACLGIGVGAGASFRTASEIGWLQWPQTPEIGDCLKLASESNQAPRQLLSVCAASGSVAEAESRGSRYPHALAEDMEGFAVAAACSLAGVSLRIVRGISNQAGDREHSRWQIEAAMRAALSTTEELLTQNEL